MLTQDQIDHLWEQYQNHPDNLFANKLATIGIVTNAELSGTWRDAFDTPGARDSATYYDDAIFALICFLLLDAGETL